MQHHPRTYPPSWPNVKLIEPITKTIRDEIEQEQRKAKCAGNNLSLFVIRVSWKASTKILQQEDLVPYFIKTANVMKSKVVCFVLGINDQRIQPKAHYHAIIGISTNPSSKPTIEDVKRALNKASKGEVLSVGVKAYNPSQRPFTDEDYIIGKHSWMMFQEPVFTPRKSLKM